jgi:hypothetical protein
MKRKKLSTKIAVLNRRLNLLFDELSAYPPHILTVNPDPQSWNVLQVLTHVQQSEEKSLQYVRKKIQYPEGLKRIGLIHHWRSFGLNLSLRLPLKYKSPASVNFLDKSTPSFGELKKSWLENRQELAGFVSEVDEVFLGMAVYRHPVAGRMGLVHMINFLSVHFDRHRQQALRTAEEVSSR